MLSSSLTFDTISFYYDFLIVAYCLICHHLTLRHYNNRKVQTTNFFRHYFHNANDIFFISFGKAFCAAEMHMKHSHKLYPSFSPLVDFLIQEVNREINTIGSKASDLAIANIVVDVKSEIEKIREQIQNIE
mgnify:CR=1 FL=1